ncbi:MAG TPA: Na+/H+ antiporter [Baekduia sp.]|nr:Na+/H+ antiporter [Baekduia sp.]
MHEAELFVGLLIAVVLVALAVRQLEAVPDAVALVAGGLVAGLLPFTPDIRLNPEVIFVVFLPPILYPSAFAFSFEDVRTNLRPIAGLAFGLVLATVGAIAVAAHLVGGIAWPTAFILGAVLAPTDPVAATTVIRSAGAPSGLATTLEGESLINDGTSLTALKIAIGTVGASFSLWSSIGQFALVALGGAAIGAGLAWLTAQLRRRLDDFELESAIAVLLAYGAYIAAERAGVSGVLAVVLAGYVMGRSEDISSADTRLAGESFWTASRFLSESILFLLVGIAFANVVSEPGVVGGGTIAGLTALVVATAIGMRLLWMFTVPYLAGAIESGRDGLAALVGPRERIVLSAGGLRGAVSVAAALSIPLSHAGTDVADRATVIAVAIAAIVVLLVVPALVLPLVLRAVGLAGAEDHAEIARQARAQLAAAALARTDEIAEQEHVPGPLLQSLRERYLNDLRIENAAPDGDDAPDDGTATAEHFRALRQAALQARRDRLAELRDEGTVHGSILRDLERELDVEELRIG